MSRVLALLLAAAVACLTGCTLVSSEHPLSDAKTSVADNRLLGEWDSIDPKTGEPAKSERLIVRTADEGVAYHAGGPNQEQRTTWFTTEIGDRRFISATVKEEAGAVLYLILQYEVRGEELRMFLMHPEKTADAIAKGHIEGKVLREAPSADDPEGRKLKEVKLTATSEQLRKFLGSKMGQAVIHTDEPAMLFKRAP